MDFNFEDKVQELHTYIDKWAEDMRTALNIAQPGGTIGVSFLPEFKLPRVPVTNSVLPGIYMSRQGSLQVEVTQQTQGQVVFEYTQPNGEPVIQAMSSLIFETLFVPLNQSTGQG